MTFARKWPECNQWRKIFVVLSGAKKASWVCSVGQLGGLALKIWQLVPSRCTYRYKAGAMVLWWVGIPGWAVCCSWLCATFRLAFEFDFTFTWPPTTTGAAAVLALWESVNWQSAPLVQFHHNLGQLHALVLLNMHVRVSVYVHGHECMGFCSSPFLCQWRSLTCPWNHTGLLNVLVVYSIGLSTLSHCIFVVGSTHDHVCEWVNNRVP